MQEKLNVETKMVNADHFSNGITVYSFSLNVEPEILPNLKRYCSLCFSIPPKALYKMFLSGDLSGRELLYLNSACRFAYYFLTNENENFDALFDHFKHDPSNQARLAELGSSLGSEEVPISNTYGAVTRNLEVSKELFIDFARRQTGDFDGHVYADVSAMIEKVRDPQDRQLLSWMHKFNQSVTATNLWKPEAAAVSFCMDPTKFLGQHRIPEVPYAVYMILGLDFTGFHIRFRDISRGGVRIIKSSEET